MTASLVKFLALMGACLLLASCAQTGPPLPPSLELPKPPSDLHASRKGDQVTLTWSEPTRTTDRQSVRYLGPTRICRSLEAEMSECGNPVAQLRPTARPAVSSASTETPQRISIETLPFDLQYSHPLRFAVYAVEVLNRDGRGAGLSNRVRVPLVPTWPPFDGFAAHITASGVRITWSSPPPPGRAANFRCLFRIYRRTEGTTNESRIADIDLGRCGSINLLSPVASGTVQSSDQPIDQGSDNGLNSFLDQTFEWEKTYFYHGTVVSVLTDSDKREVEVEGDDTLEVKVVAHDVFPPVVPSGLQAVYSGEGQKPFVDLIWAPATDADLAGYNVYRRDGDSAPAKVNPELVKSPSYRDSVVASGKTYSYSVSAVDVRGNESARSEEASETVP
ncbi:MAG: fibronectin type III domain-containing protein [Terriglobales bacterium]